MSSIETISRPASSVKDPFAELFRKGKVSRKAIEAIRASGNSMVTASEWQLILNNDSVSLSCTLAANSSDNLITTVGLLLSDNNGNVLGSFYFYTNDDGMSTGSSNPILSAPQGDLSDGSTASATVFGMLAGGQFYNPGTSVTVSSS